MRASSSAHEATNCLLATIWIIIKKIAPNCLVKQANIDLQCTDYHQACLQTNLIKVHYNYAKGSQSQILSETKPN